MNSRIPIETVCKGGGLMDTKRTPAKKKARELAKLLRSERP